MFHWFDSLVSSFRFYRFIIILLVLHSIFTDRYPNHEASKRIDQAKEYQEEIQKLRSDDGDFYHGFNCGVLAAARLFSDQSDITHVNEKVRVL
jgi:hypothetical protein